MDRPILKETKYGQNIYDSNEWETFFKGGMLNYSNSDISGKTIYVQAKTISQNKLRESGFVITRDSSKADVIVISDFYNSKNSYSYGVKGTVAIKEAFDIESFFDKYKQSNTYILDKYLYKYDGNQDLFYSCKDLLNSKINDNVKMAMEFISNANWTNNEIYLYEIFNLYWIEVMRNNTYKNSISFKGFLTSLDFNHETSNLYEASDYRVLCKNEEHHEWIYKKYEEAFKQELDELVKSFKIKLDKIEYSIDRNTVL
jgi:hypothetical protein